MFHPERVQGFHSIHVALYSPEGSPIASALSKTVQGFLSIQVKFSVALLPALPPLLSKMGRVIRACLSKKLFSRELKKLQLKG